MCIGFSWTLTPKHRALLAEHSHTNIVSLSLSHTRPPFLTAAPSPIWSATAPPSSPLLTVALPLSFTGGFSFSPFHGISSSLYHGISFSLSLPPWFGRRRLLPHRRFSPSSSSLSYWLLLLLSVSRYLLVYLSLSLTVSPPLSLSVFYFCSSDLKWWRCWSVLDLLMNMLDLLICLLMKITKMKICCWKSLSFSLSLWFVDLLLICCKWWSVINVSMKIKKMKIWINLLLINMLDLLLMNSCKCVKLIFFFF